MCVIAIVKNKINQETLLKCWQTNSDGMGVAWFEKGLVKWKKGLVFYEMSDLIKTIGPPYVIHFRKASVGGINTELTHPFIISPASEIEKEGTNKMLLFHNGHFDNYNIFQSCLGIHLTGPVSDSRVIASVVSKRGYNLLKILGEQGNKFTVMTNKKIKLFGDKWREHEDNLFSNLNWKSCKFQKKNGKKSLIFS